MSPVCLLFPNSLEGAKMANVRSVHEITVNLAVSTPQVLNIPGDFLFVWSSGTTFTARVDERQPIQLRQGALLQVEEFQKVEIESSSVQTVVIKYGFGSYTELSAEISIDQDQPAIETFVETTNTVSSSSASVGAGAVTSILPTDGAGTRRQSIISNPSTNAGLVWVREDGVASPGGVPLEIGEKLITNTADELFVFNPNGVSTDIYVQSELSV